MVSKFLPLVVLFFYFLFFLNSPVSAGTVSKFLGNTDIGYSGSYGDFADYWTQITPDSSGKWKQMENSQGQFDWTRSDQLYAFARAHNILVKQHTFIWNLDQPDWLINLSASQQKSAVETWMQAYCQRYPDVHFIDVVNEPLHQAPFYKNALGGDGATGWDWVIWSYQKARQYCPNAKLLINEYGTMRDSNWRTQLKQIIQLLKDRNLIDGVGLQAYTQELANAPPVTVKAALDDYWNMGISIYISELSISNAGDAQQLSIYQQYFPVFWQHPGVQGVTLWGYRQGYMYESDAYLLRSDGSKRPAFSWLMSYVASLIIMPSPTVAPTFTPTPTPTPKLGDANGDGHVEETDYGIWLSHFGQTVSGGRTVGDFDGNGTVDGVDYSEWLKNYGT